MCGITGIAALDDALNPELMAAIAPMTSVLSHRGPDDEGFLRTPRVVLGHRRLSIIDRSGGHQPLSNEDGTCWVAFNGEVYNHHDLRPRLAGLGHLFRTRSDTEVIVHAWEEYGPKCVDLLEGMFAFAIVDTRRHEVFLARDRLGKKPLFYAVLDRTLHFASEIKAIATSPAFDFTPDSDALLSCLMLGYTIAPMTAYRSVRQLEPGHSLHLKEGAITVRSYWDVRDFDSDVRVEAQVLRDLDPMIRTAVRDRLESEVPLGVFLSGGIDSGLVTSYMAEVAAQPVIATSVGFASAAHDELAAARVTAGHVHAQHHEEVVSPSLAGAVEIVLGGFDEPFADPSAIPTWHVSRMARQFVTVALSGDGGDEAFAGYSFRYVPVQIESIWRQALPGRFGQGLASKLGGVWPRQPGLPRPLRVGSVLDNLATTPADAYFRDLCFLKPPEALALAGSTSTNYRDTSVFAAVTDAFGRCPSSSLLQRTQYADLKIYLPSVLTKVDRMSMQNSLEVRSPLLDRRLIEFAFRLPTGTKMPRFESKHLLRKLAEQRLPRELARMPKKGFSPPLGEWLAGEGGQRLAEDVLHRSALVRGWLDVSHLAGIFARRGEQRSGDTHALWCAWLLEAWLRRNRENEITAVASRGRGHAC
jgi:asparagine synthase (glutamine-hydrolysing)